MALLCVRQCKVPGLQLFTCTLCPIYYKCTPKTMVLKECTQIAHWLSPFTDIFLFCLRRYFTFSRDKRTAHVDPNWHEDIGHGECSSDCCGCLNKCFFFKDLYICRRKVGTCTAKMDTLTCTQRPMNDDPGLWCFRTPLLPLTEAHRQTWILWTKTEAL